VSGWSRLGCVPMQPEDKVIDDVDKKLRGREHVWIPSRSFNVRYSRCQNCSCVKGDSLTNPTVTTECPRREMVESIRERIQAGMLDYTEELGWHDPRNGMTKTSTT
jgi:hypothetical protein